MNLDVQALLDNTQASAVVIDKTITSLAGQLQSANDSNMSLQDKLNKQIIENSDLKGKVTLRNIQSVQPETLWYEARSANAPKTGPHGTVAIRLGEPAIADFRPVVLDGKNSDNIYCLNRRYNYLTPAEKLIMEQASKFSVGCTVSLDPLANVQAFEWDYQIRKSSGVVINVGLQLLPDGTLRGFHFVKKDWEQLGPKVNLITAKPITIEVDATSDDLNVQFTQVVTDGVVTALTFNHPVSKDIVNSPYFNCAYQLDGRPDGTAYKATIGFMTATFS
jgi:hypothetical protein